MTDLEKLFWWLREYPHWGGYLQVDRLEDESDGIGIFPKGLEELSRQEDVQGRIPRFWCDRCGREVFAERKRLCDRCERRAGYEKKNYEHIR